MVAKWFSAVATWLPGGCGIAFGRCKLVARCLRNEISAVVKWLRRVVKWCAVGAKWFGMVLKWFWLPGGCEVVLNGFLRLCLRRAGKGGREEGRKGGREEGGGRGIWEASLYQQTPDVKAKR